MATAKRRKKPAKLSAAARKLGFRKARTRSGQDVSAQGAYDPKTGGYASVEKNPGRYDKDRPWVAHTSSSPGGAGHLSRHKTQTDAKNEAARRLGLKKKKRR